MWDEVLTGAEHNVATSAGRRLRTLQTGGNYENGAVWVDTINGVAGTEDDINGTVTNPVDLWASAQTIATSIGLYHFHFFNSSEATLDADTSSKEISGDEFIIHFGGQTINNTSITGGLYMDGTFLGYPHLLHTGVGTAGITGPGAKLGFCAIRGSIVSNAATNTWVVHDCWGTSASASAFDFGAAVAAAQTVYITSYHGPINIANMDHASDILYLSGNGNLIVGASSTTGTIYLSGQWIITNNGTTTIVYDGLTTDAAAILVDTGTTIPALIGTPAADVSADIAAVKVDTAATLVDTGTTLPATIGTPVGADISADIAAVKAETALIVADTNELQTDWANGGRLDLLLDSIKGVTDALGLTAAANLALSAGRLKLITVDTITNTHTPTTTEFQCDDITEATVDHYKDRIVLWLTGALGAEAGQATEISAYAAVGGIGQFTVVAMTEAPANNDTALLI